MHTVNAAALATAILAKPRKDSLTGYHNTISTIPFHSRARSTKTLKNTMGIKLRIKKGK